MVKRIVHAYTHSPAARIIPLLLLSVLLCTSFPIRTLADAAPPLEKGLLITPLRQFLSTDAGSTQKSTLTIANLTDNPLNVNLSVKQFSVTDYVYNYRFNQPKNNWIHLSSTDVALQPNQTRDINYSIQVPSGSAPGGSYYTLFASANLSSQGIQSTIQAADLVYLTVNGKLTTVSHLQSSSIPWLSFGRTIPFKLNPINTGNVYSFVYVSGQLHGLFVRQPQTSSAHLLMPGKVRLLEGSIASPVLPGVYRATYGYKTTSNWIVQQSRWVIYIPPWFIAFVLAALLFTGKFLPGRKSQKSAKSANTSTDKKGTP